MQDIIKTTFAKHFLFVVLESEKKFNFNLAFGKDCILHMSEKESYSTGLNPFFGKPIFFLNLVYYIAFKKPAEYF